MAPRGMSAFECVVCECITLLFSDFMLIISDSYIKPYKPNLCFKVTMVTLVAGHYRPPSHCSTELTWCADAAICVDVFHSRSYSGF